MKFLLILSFVPLVLTFSYACLIRTWPPSDDFGQKIFGVCLWLITAVATFVILKVGGLSFNWAGLVVGVISVAGFFAPGIGHFLISRLFQDPAKTGPETAPTN